MIIEIGEQLSDALSWLIIGTIGAWIFTTYMKCAVKIKAKDL